MSVKGQSQLHMCLPPLQQGSSVTVTHVPLFHALVCPGVIVAPAHSTLLLPSLPSRGEEADVNIELEVRRVRSVQTLSACCLCKLMLCVCINGQVTADDVCVECVRVTADVV